MKSLKVIRSSLSVVAFDNVDDGFKVNIPCKKYAFSDYSWLCALSRSTITSTFPLADFTALGDIINGFNYLTVAELCYGIYATYPLTYARLLQTVNFNNSAKFGNISVNTAAVDGINYIRLREALTLIKFSEVNLDLVDFLIVDEDGDLIELALLKLNYFKRLVKQSSKAQLLIKASREKAKTKGFSLS